MYWLLIKKEKLMKNIILIITMILFSATAKADSDDHDKYDDDHYKRVNYKQIFNHLDVNQDQKLSFQEYVGFAKLDQNNDGSISLAEFAKMREHHEDDDHFSLKRLFKKHH